ncbi:MAG: antibiotic biosynthesis monooxygenase [Sphingomonadales bacterium]|nr:antibiotic biosynthesis monooxygenase [Sphingomonadales bacterium]NCT03797.1 antibiotic biosynthesis monooxygenase [Sphingomonadales bacterium]
MADRLNVMARIKPHREHLDAARSAICEIMDRTRAEPGCITFRLSENEEDGSLHLYEEWSDEAALTSHHEQPYTKAVFKAYEEWLAEEPQIVHLRPVR